MKKQKEKKSKAVDQTPKESVGKILGYLLDNTFYYYDVCRKAAKTVKIRYKKPQGSDDLIVGRHYYVIGGINARKETIAFPLPDLKPGCIKASLNCGRIFSTSIGFTSEYIFTIGGRASNGASMTACEKYSICKDKWSLTSPLNVPRECATLAFFDNRYLYVFEGRSNWVYQFTFEKYDLFDSDAGWILTTPVELPLHRPARGGALCVQVSNKGFIIAGGTETFDEHGFNDTYCFDTVDLLYSKKKAQLQRGAEFYPNIAVHKGHFYQLSYSYNTPSYDLFDYSIIRGRFRMFKALDLWKKELFHK